jgi:hypothetical protein
MILARQVRMGEPASFPATQSGSNLTEFKRMPEHEVLRLDLRKCPQCGIGIWLVEGDGGYLVVPYTGNS